MGCSRHLHTLTLTFGIALGPVLLGTPRPSLAQTAAQSPYVGVFENTTGVRLELRAAVGKVLVGTVWLERVPFTVNARIEGRQLVGTFSTERQSISFKGSLEGNELTVSSDFDTHTLRRVGVQSPVREKARGPIGSGWKLVKHPGALQIQHPPEWNMVQGKKAYNLLTGDNEETIFFGGFSVEGLSDPRDPLVARAADQMMGQYAAGFVRRGSFFPARDGAGRGIALLYMGEHEGRRIRGRMWITIINGTFMSLTAIMPEDKLIRHQATLDKVFASLKEAQVQLDPKLVGTWLKLSEAGVDAKNSGGRKSEGAPAVTAPNFAATLGADGNFQNGAIRKGMASRDGQPVEYDPNESLKGTWSAAGGKLLLIWEDSSTDEYDYSLSGARLVLKGGGREFVYQR